MAAAETAGGEDILADSGEPALGRVAEADLHAFCLRIGLSRGLSDDCAAALADVLVDADARGIYSHGVHRLPRYMEDIERGAVDVSAEPVVVTETEAAALVDGSNGLGMAVAKFAMELAMTKAANHGIAIVTVKGSNHYGTAGYYARMASARQLIGIAMTNSPPAVAPTYSKRPALGTNPIAFAAPVAAAAAATDDPSFDDEGFVLDMATSTASLGKVENLNREGKPLPPGWGLGFEGQATTSAEDVIYGGSLAPLGGAAETSGYKGYGLALLVEVLCGALSGSKMGNQLEQWITNDRPANRGHAFLVIDPAVFGGGFTNRMAGLVEMMHGLEPVDGADQVRVPGDGARVRRADNAERGIPLTARVLASLDELAESVGVEPVARLP